MRRRPDAKQWGAAFPFLLPGGWAADRERAVTRCGSVVRAFWWRRLASGRTWLEGTPVWEDPSGMGLERV